MTELIQPLTQSLAFERTCRRLGLAVRRVESEAGSCLIQSRKLPLIGDFHLASRGPVLAQPDGLADLINQVRAETRGPLVINAPAGIDPKGGLRLARGADLAILDLDTPDLMRRRLHQKWRNQLRKGEKSPLRVINQPLDARRHAWFFEAEQKQQKTRKYRSYPPEVLLAYAAENKGQARLYTALHETRPVAAMLVLKHGRMATYQAGTTSDEGRGHSAHNLLLWTIMTDLERARIRHLDLGRADLSTGLRRFKLGSGARIESLPGTYLFHRLISKPGSVLSRSHATVRKAA